MHCRHVKNGPKRGYHGGRFAYGRASFSSQVKGHRIMGSLSTRILKLHFLFINALLFVWQTNCHSDWKLLPALKKPHQLTIFICQFSSACSASFNLTKIALFFLSRESVPLSPVPVMGRGGGGILFQLRHLLVSCSGPAHRITWGRRWRGHIAGPSLASSPPKSPYVVRLPKAPPQCLLFVFFSSRS